MRRRPIPAMKTGMDAAPSQQDYDRLLSGLQRLSLCLPKSLNDLLAGEGGIISTEPARRVMALARDVAADPALRGAFARQADKDGQLEPGDLNEAFLAMAAAGDPEFESTGDRRRDALSNGPRCRGARYPGRRRTHRPR